MDFGSGSRPRIKIPYTTVDRLLLAATALALCAAWVCLAGAWGSLPQRIATHFGASGQANGWGGKGGLLFLPITSTAICAAISLLSRFPHVYNYAVPITAENAERQYRNGRSLLLWLSTELALLFLYVEWNIVRVAQGLADGFGLWFLPACMLVLFGTIGWFIYRMAKER